jgi:acyl dehydratase
VANTGALMDSIHFETLPKSRGFLARALLQRKRGLGEGTIPRISADVAPMMIDPQHLAAYRALTAHEAGDRLPLCFPHILGAPLHGVLLTSASFPLPAMGLIHVANRIEQHRTIAMDEALAITCWVDGHRAVANGIEFDLMTSMTSSGEVVWESVTTILAIASKKGGGGKKKARPFKPGGVAPELTRTAIWSLRSDLGRRYAKISGDFNPIHLYPLTAKLFGFKQPIMHGMWSLARCAAELASDVATPHQRLDVRFKRPVFLPGRVLFGSRKREEDEGTTFRLASADGRIPHLEGVLHALV